MALLQFTEWLLKELLVSGMKNIFSHLRISSEFSISQGLLTINQIVDCAQKNNIPSVALTEVKYVCHGKIF